MAEAMREEIARIIDPAVFAKPRANLHRERYEMAFAKADAILALRAAAPPEGARAELASYLSERPVDNESAGRFFGPCIIITTEKRDEIIAALSPAAAGGEEKPDDVARSVVEKWLWDCGESQVLGFVQSELLQQRIRDVLPSPDQANEAAQSARVKSLEEAIREACDFLAERTYGSPARSPGHNARVRLESALLSSSDQIQSITETKS